MPDSPARPEGDRRGSAPSGERSVVEIRLDRLEEQAREMKRHVGGDGHGYPGLLERVQIVEHSLYRPKSGEPGLVESVRRLGNMQRRVEVAVYAIGLLLILINAGVDISPLLPFLR